MDKKKEYVAPEMDVIEYMVKTPLLLEGSPDGPTAENIEFD